MIYKFKDQNNDTSLEVEAVREKAQITFFGKTEDNGIDLDLEELQKLINALNTVAAEIRAFKQEINTELNKNL